MTKDSSHHEDQSASTADLVRSAALSSAELWHEILERLRDVQESQVRLAAAIEGLGLMVRDALGAGAVHPSLETSSDRGAGLALTTERATSALEPSHRSTDHDTALTATPADAPATAFTAAPTDFEATPFTAAPSTGPDVAGAGPVDPQAGPRNPLDAPPKNPERVGRPSTVADPGARGTGGARIGIGTDPALDALLGFKAPPAPADSLMSSVETSAPMQRSGAAEVTEPLFATEVPEPLFYVPPFDEEVLPATSVVELTSSALDAVLAAEFGPPPVAHQAPPPPPPPPPPAAGDGVPVAVAQVTPVDVAPAPQVAPMVVPPGTQMPADVPPAANDVDTRRADSEATTARPDPKRAVRTTDPNEILDILLGTRRTADRADGRDATDAHPTYDLSTAATPPPVTSEPLPMAASVATFTAEPAFTAEPSVTTEAPPPAFTAEVPPSPPTFTAEVPPPPPPPAPIPPPVAFAPGAQRPANLTAEPSPFTAEPAFTAEPSPFTAEPAFTPEPTFTAEPTREAGSVFTGGPQTDDQPVPYMAAPPPPPLHPMAATEVTGAEPVFAEEPLTPFLHSADEGATEAPTDGVVTSVASMATEILSATPDIPTVAVPDMRESELISKDLTLIARGRKKRFRLR